MTFDAQMVNPYDPTQVDYDVTTPRAHEVLDEAMRQLALTLRVALPARVTTVLSAQRVQLQPLFCAQYVGRVSKALPIIPEAHVVLLGGTAWGLKKAPLAVGDLGLALVADRNLGVWAASDGTQPLDPQDNRSHNLSDSFFLPGAVPTALESQDTSPDMVWVNGPTSLRIGPSGFSLSNGNVELLALVKALASQVQSLANAVAQITSAGFSVDPPSKAALSAQAAAAGQLAGQAQSLTAQT